MTTSLRGFCHVMVMLQIAAVSQAQIRITNPGENFKYFDGDTVYLTCEPDTNEINAGNEMRILWFSDIDGLLDSSASAFANQLSIGEHTLSVIGIFNRDTVFKDSVHIEMLKYDVDVYCVGGMSDKAVNWKNGVLKELPAAKDYLNRVVCWNCDVYFLEDNQRRATYWHNGSLIEMPSASQFQSCIKDIAVSDQGVFAVGIQIDTMPYRWICTEWDNGIPNELPVVSPSIVTSITISGTDIFACGSDDFGLYYWENRIQVLLPSSEHEKNSTPDTISHAAKIGSFNGKIVIAGYDQVAVGDEAFGLGWIWNGETKQHIIGNPRDSLLQNPENGVTLDCFSMGQKGIFAAGGCVGNMRQYIWENGASRVWRGPAGEDTSRISALYVLHNHLFTAGDYTENGVTKMCYWRNEKRFELPGGEPGWRINDICAIERPDSAPVRPSRIRSKKTTPAIGANQRPYFKILSSRVESLKVEFFLPTAQPVTVEITDMQGRIVCRAMLGLVQAGIHREKINIPGSLTGFYTLRLKHGAGRLAGSVVLSR